jgi:hypothetical protein
MGSGVERGRRRREDRSEGRERGRKDRGTNK